MLEQGLPGKAEVSLDISAQRVGSEHFAGIKIILAGFIDNSKEVM